MKTFGITSLGFLTIIILFILSFTVKTGNIAERNATQSMENAVVSYDES